MSAGSVFDDIADQAMDAEGSYAAARLALARAKADAGPELRSHYEAALASLRRRYGEDANA